MQMLINLTKKLVFLTSLLQNVVGLTNVLTREETLDASDEVWLLTLFCIIVKSFHFI